MFLMFQFNSICFFRCRNRFAYVQEGRGSSGGRGRSVREASVQVGLVTKRRVWTHGSPTHPHTRTPRQDCERRWEWLRELAAVHQGHVVARERQQCYQGAHLCCTPPRTAANAHSRSFLCAGSLYFSSVRSERRWGHQVGCWLYPQNSHMS